MPLETYMKVYSYPRSLILWRQAFSNILKSGCDKATSFLPPRIRNEILPILLE